MEKKVSVKFNIQHKANYEKVSVAGTFNNWNAEADYLKHEDSGWTTELFLEPGYYEYKFVINGNLWVNDENNYRLNIIDQNNSILLVEETGVNDFNLPYNKNIFPQLIYPDEKIVNVYDDMIKQIFTKIRYGNNKNNFSKLYFDEAKDDCIYQWDSIFNELFLMYGNGILPVLETIDIFYKKQSKDGYIPRLLKTIDGQTPTEFRRTAPLINPPIFSFIEWEYIYFTGDTERIKNNFEKLVNYFQWIETNLVSEQNPNLYYNTLLGSGMDNSPRNSLNKKSCWIDMSSQQALSALLLAKISKLLNNQEKENYFLKRYNEIKNCINNLCWNNEKNFYFDIKEDSTHLIKKTCAGFWTLIAQIPSAETVEKIVSHFYNPDEFFRKNVVPTLSADEGEFFKEGWYWRGGVWSQINYILFEGLKNYNYFYLPYILTKRNLKNIVDVYYNFEAEQEKMSPTERDHYKNTFWEAYAPDYEKPATRWDNIYYCKPNFVGWTALTIINMFIKNILGFDFNGLDNTLRLRIFEIDESFRGLNNFNFKNRPMKILYKLENKKIIINYNYDGEFNLELFYKDKYFKNYLSGKENIIEVQI